MAEYIDRELLLNDLETSIVVSGRPEVAPLELRGVHKVINRIKAMPTEDVVPVVRCSQCKYYTENHLCFHPKQEYGWNSQGGECLQMEANDYCSYGERKNDDGNL